MSKQSEVFKPFADFRDSYLGLVARGMIPEANAKRERFERDTLGGKTAQEIGNAIRTTNWVYNAEGQLVKEGSPSAPVKKDPRD